MEFASRANLGEGKCNFECVSNMYLWSVPWKRGKYAGGRERWTDSGGKKKEGHTEYRLQEYEEETKRKTRMKAERKCYCLFCNGKGPH